MSSPTRLPKPQNIEISKKPQRIDLTLPSRKKSYFY